MDEYRPLIISATITPQPTIVGQRVLLSVAAVDALLDPADDVIYTDEFVSGEV